MRTRSVLLSLVGLLIAGFVLAGCGDKDTDASSASDPTTAGVQSDPSDVPSSSGEPSEDTSQVDRTFDAYPPMSIDTKKKYTATFVLAKGGTFTIELFAAKAPKTVNSFVFLARKKYFNGVTFHRVIEGFMAQGGDPTGTGTGGPGYQFEDEFAPDLTFDKAGILAMANSGPATNGSQFFITFAPTPHLNGLHTIFGQVTSGLDVVLGITEREPSMAAGPGDAIKSVRIAEK